MVNRQFVLAARPEGLIREADFRLVESPVPPVRDGEMLVRARYLSVDPYMRGRMSAARSYAPPVELGQVMTGGGVGEVIESRITSGHAKFRAGDIVNFQMGWQEYAISDGENVRTVDPSLAPISTAVGILGMPGITAYYGVTEICAVQAGETFVVSGAAGAVGSAAGQIASIRGAHVVGITGGPKKVDYILRELGFHDAIDYKTDPDIAGALRDTCPHRVDAYFDNVGGRTTDAVLGYLNTFARIGICGQISLANDSAPSPGPRMYRQLLVARARVQGFLVLDFARPEEALAELAGWIASGDLKYREDVIEGFENMPKALIGLFLGENIGKRVVRVA
jgi:NADPH-dependent curcumin reductase CurA